MAKLYKWNDDRKVHTIPLARHQANLKAKPTKPKAGGGKKASPPIVPGSSLTVRDVRKGAKAAVGVEFGPQIGEAKRGVGEAKTFARDIGGPGGFYDQYLAKLAQHTQNVKQIGQTAATAVQGAQQGVTGLSQATLAPIQGQANQQAAATGMGPAGDLSGLASNAAAVRQALVGSFVADQAARNAAASTYADTLANVVGPGQKLGGQAMAQGKIKEARTTLGGVRRQAAQGKAKYIAETKADEAKNVYALTVATGKTAAEQAKEVTRQKAATAKGYGHAGSAMNKYGYTYDEWNKLTPAQRTKARAGKGPQKPTTGYGTGLPGLNKYGYSYDEWTALSPDAQAKARKGKGPKPTKVEGAPGFTPQEAADFKAKFGVAPATAPRVERATREIARAKEIIRNLIASQPKATRGQLGASLLAGKTPGKLRDKNDKITGKDRYHWRAVDPLWASVVLDLREGGITAGTAGRLHRIGYSAQALGIPLKKPDPTQKNTGAYGHAAPQPQGHY